MDSRKEKLAHLHLLSWNAGSVLSKINALKALIATHQPHAMLIQETFLKANHPSPEIANYTWHRADRMDCRGGGVALLVSNSVDFTPCPPPAQLSTAEIAGGHIHTQEGKLYIASLYLPPSQTRKKDIGKILRFQKFFIIAGDLNAHWTPWGSKKSNNAGNFIDYWANQLDLNVQIPPEHTRIHPGNPEKDSTLDYAITHPTLQQVEMTVHPLTESDHRPISFKTPKFNIFSPPNFKITRDWEGIANEVNFIDWPHFVLPTPDNVAKAAEFLTSSLQAALLNNTKVIKLKSKHKKLIPREIKVLQQEKSKYHKEFHRTRDPRLKPIINQINRKIHTSMRNWETEKRNKILQDLDDPDERWQAIKTSKKPQKIATLGLPGKPTAYNNKEKADMIAESLAERFTELDTKTVNPLSSFTPPDPSPLYDVPTIEVSDVKLAILASRANSSAGHDGISYRLLKLLPPEGVMFLTHLFNAIIRSQSYPSEWKRAVIIPIHKEGKDPHNPSNYRPISLTPCISKIFEKCLLPHLEKIERRLKVIPNHQMGFRAKHSTTHQLTRTAEELITNWNEKQHSVMVTLDVEAAFDKVPHKLLLGKMHKLGYPEWVLALLGSYFSQRCFIVRIDEEISETHPILAGTPQGATLSAFLYNNYISDMPKPKKNCGKASQYADDTCYTTHAFTLFMALVYMTDTLVELDEWCSLWRVKINGPKSNVMVITPKRTYAPPNLFVNGEEIPVVTQSKYLGIIFDNKLTWKDHLKYALTKAKQRTAFFHQRFYDSHRLSTDTRLLIYETLIRPILTYGAPAWLGAAITYKQKLMTLERRWMRKIFKMPCYTKLDNVYKTAEPHMLHLEDFLRNSATKFYSVTSVHTNPEIRKIGKHYAHHFNIKQRTKRTGRLYPFQMTATGR